MYDINSSIDCFVSYRQEIKNLGTSIDRAEIPLKVLDDYFSNHKSINFLKVGIGQHNYPFLSPITPYVYYAIFKEKFLDFKMTLVERETDIVNDILERRYVFEKSDLISGLPQNNMMWKKYNNLVWSKSESIFYDEQIPQDVAPHLVMFGDEISRRLVEEGNEDLLTSEHMEAGIYYAPIPDGFISDIGKKVDLINEDAVDFESDTRYDYALIQNVLYQMPKGLQAIILKNISGSLKKGGILLLNDSGSGYYKHKLFPEFEGWLDSSALSVLGLNEIEIKATNEKHIHKVLQKI